MPFSNYKSRRRDAHRRKKRKRKGADRRRTKGEKKRSHARQGERLKPGEN